MIERGGYKPGAPSELAGPADPCKSRRTTANTSPQIRIHVVFAVPERQNLIRPPAGAFLEGIVGVAVEDSHSTGGVFGVL
jgi:hypothetical protein